MASKVLLIESLNSRSDILKRFWNRDVADTEKYELYFKYYDHVCSRLSTSSEIMAMNAKTHEDVFHVMDVLWHSADIKALTRQGLREALGHFTPPSTDRSTYGDFWMPSSHPLSSSADGSRADKSAEQQKRSRSDEMMDNTINLALRLWLTMDIRARQFGGVADVQWDENSSLSKFIDQQFPREKKWTSEVHSRDVWLDDRITAPSLFRRRGIKTQFTDKLTHHLFFDRKAQIMMIYPLRHYLSLHKTCKAGVFPEKLIDETIKSLGILFPKDPETDIFMRKFQFSGRLGYDYPFPLPGSMRLSEFDYWQDRLAEICSILEGPPTTWRQKFREDLAGWFSFWGAAVAITVMTFVFGSASVGLAVWSVLIAEQSLELAREGLALARDAAKSAANTATSCVPTVSDVSMTTAIVKLIKQF